MTDDPTIKKADLESIAHQLLESVVPIHLREAIRSSLKTCDTFETCEKNLVAWTAGQHPMATVYPTGPSLPDATRKLIGMMARHLIKAVESKALSNKELHGAASVTAIMSAGEISEKVLEPVASAAGVSAILLAPILVYLAYLAGRASWGAFKEWAGKLDRNGGDETLPPSRSAR